MCANVIVDPAGKPCSVTTAVATALVIFPDESLVGTKVIVTVPETVDSLLAIGGVSLAARSCAVNTTLPLPEGFVEDVGDDELLHPQVRHPTRAIKPAAYLM